ncbi:helix-turn-helix transcriptional regulator [Actinopolymorpha rutila]|uniref:Transcriptional regulator with XRE-family HTH domain n=1 Tax=Actinopolymorpha rutila TaxID=446787 RepID=A0A852ZNW4_9ACTN|nr:helix-turn-helix transcriptional regulator [Actinopolymorpha rutila]NYH91169.1 transcriptional regulator with XRE-family HTH domain [Actinopolymorpha rutila]
MVDASEVREFLTSRRAKITPEMAGLVSYDGSRRRVPGLRREEAATLAGVSADYYKRLERGNLAGVSDSVLEAIARALQLDDAERDHLYNLARAANPTPRNRTAPAPERVRSSVRYMLDAITEAPAFVRNERRDILAANLLGRALYAPLYDDPIQPPNTARFIFLDARARDFYHDWDQAANNVVAVLRTASGKHSHDRRLAELINHLDEHSDEFRARWAAHDVRHHYSGRKHYHHPLIGEVELMFEAMPLGHDQGLTLAVYPARPGSAAANALRLLASWTLPSQDHTTPKG